MQLSRHPQLVQSKPVALSSPKRQWNLFLSPNHYHLRNASHVTSDLYSPSSMPWAYQGEDATRKAPNMISTFLKPSWAYGQNSSNIPICIAAEMPHQKNLAQRDLLLQARNIIQSEDLMMSHKPKMIANQGGFSLFRMMNDMERRLGIQEEKLNIQSEILNTQAEKLDIQKEKLGVQKETLDHQQEMLTRMERIEILGRIAGLVHVSTESKRFKAAQQERNASVHGANIKLDLEALDWMRNNNEEERRPAAIEGFEKIYDLPIGQGYSLDRTAPKDIIEAVNKRSDLNNLHCYLNSRHHKQEIENMKEVCTAIIDLWGRHADLEHDEIRVNLSELQRLHGLWRSGEDERLRIFWEEEKKAMGLE